MPHPATICRWLDVNLAFREQYSRARELQADILAAETLTLADTCRMGEKSSEKRSVDSAQSVASMYSGGAVRGVIPRTGPTCARGPRRRSCARKRSRLATWWSGSRLQIDARKWYAGKLAPKKYGDTHQVNVDMTAQISAVSVTLGQSLGLEELEGLRAKLLAAAAPGAGEAVGGGAELA